MSTAPELFPRTPLAAAAAPLPGDWARMAWRQRWLLGVCTVLLGGLAVGFVSTQKPVYATTAKVWVQTEQQGSPSFLSGIAAYRDSPIPDPVNRKIETEMELMHTRSSAQQVIERLGITEGQLARAPMDQLMSVLRPLLPSSGSKPDVAPRLEELLLKGLSVTPQRSGTADTTSNVLEVRFECADPALAPRVLQALLDNYLRMGEQQNRLLGQATSRLVEAKMSEARHELAGIEESMLKLSLREPGRDAIVPRSTGTGRSSVPGGALRFDLGPDLTGAAQTQVMTQLKSLTQDLQAQLEAARQLYTEDSENVRTLRTRLNEAQARLRSGVAAAARADAEMNRLERARGMAQERYVELRRKLDQIELYLQLNPSDAASRTVIDPPLTPQTPERSRRSLVLVLGLFGGLMLGLLLGGLREMFDRRLHTPDDVRRQLGLPVLGSLPQLGAGDQARLEAPL
jgi:uncharacterized protein involved in exopolysaccharide biosynthesis